VDPAQGSGEWRKRQEDDVVQPEEVRDVMMNEDLDESLKLIEQVSWLRGERVKTCRRW
jgi:hypothetical protein